MWDEIASKFQKYVETEEFDGDQLTEIMEGLKSDVEIIVYADPMFDAGQMQQIRIGLENNVPVKIYAYKKYDSSQMREIRLCLEDNLEQVEINSIANLRFNAGQMGQLRECYKDRISLNEIRMIMDEKFSPEQMKVLRIVCKNGSVGGAALKRLANPEYSPSQMEAFVRYISYGHDLTALCDASYTLEELEFFFNCLENHLEIEDVKAFLSKALNHERRRMVFGAYQNMSDKYAYIALNPEYDDDQAEEIIFMLTNRHKILYEFKNIWTDENENKLLNLLRKNKKGGISKLFQANKPKNLELTDGDPLKWNITKIKSWKGKVLKIYKEVEKYYIIKD